MLTDFIARTTHGLRPRHKGRHSPFPATTVYCGTLRIKFWKSLCHCIFGKVTAYFFSYILLHFLCRACKWSWYMENPTPHLAWGAHSEPPSQTTSGKASTAWSIVLTALLYTVFIHVSSHFGFLKWLNKFHAEVPGSSGAKTIGCDITRISLFWSFISAYVHCSF